MITKNYLIDKVHDKLNYLSKEDVKDSVDLILDYLNESLKEQKRVEIRNFGNFSIRKRKFPESEKFYNTVYYRMPKNLFKE
ncbi:HU family DNA-binding protein [Rickettsia montanensis]|uniref:Integration host factor beta-subunit n=1 Tax=Rickettsia montanensis (strain OSU 85-930) TaxID=1105114 RepID=H8KAN3_RICMS|nr:HU family DNA-binding protein [Rickettsia montanensis]AFC73100.1 integration host factor beta-subunit [Rickettsia montanensis str. OSU 85-930]